MLESKLDDALRGDEAPTVLEGPASSSPVGGEAHFLNPVPIRLIHDRWIDKYTERRVSALAHLKTELEETG